MGQARWSMLEAEPTSPTKGRETYNVVAKLLAVVAAARRTGATEAEGGAIGLDVAESLAVIALLRLGRARERALARLVV